MVRPLLAAHLALLFVVGLTAPAAPAQEPSASARAACDSLCIIPTRTVSFETRQGTQVGLPPTPQPR